MRLPFLRHEAAWSGWAFAIALILLSSASAKAQEDSTDVGDEDVPTSIPANATMATDSVQVPSSRGTVANADSTSPDSSDDVPKDGWHGSSAILTTGYSRSSDAGNAQTKSATLDLSSSWRKGILDVTPTASTTWENSTTGTKNAASATGQLAASLEPWEPLTMTASSFYTAQNGPDDYGGFLRIQLAHALPLHFDVATTGTATASRLEPIAPAVDITIGQDFTHFGWTTTGTWSHQSNDFTYSKSRSRTVVANKTSRVVNDTVMVDTSAYLNEWGAKMKLSAKGRNWESGPFAAATLEWIPVGTDVIAVAAKSGTTKRNSTSNTAKDETLELGWTGSWSPKEWLSLDASASNTWSWNDLELSSKGALSVPPETLKKRARQTGTSTLPTPGFTANLAATYYF